MSSGSTLFVYGSMQCPEVIEALLTRPRAAQLFSNGSPAVLYGYRRFLVKGKNYPAITKLGASSQDFVLGLIFCGLTSDEISVLDAYESSAFVLESVTVSVLASQEIKGQENAVSLENEQKQCWVYVMRIELLERVDISGTSDSYDLLEWRRLYIDESVAACREIALECRLEDERNKLLILKNVQNDENLNIFSRAKKEEELENLKCHEDYGLAFAESIRFAENL